MILAAGDTALVLGPTIVALIGFAGLFLQTRRNYREVRSPNGTSTGDAVYELRKDVLGLRLAQMEAEEQVHLDTLAARAAIDRAEEVARLVEVRATEVAIAVEAHDVEDRRRFAVVFQHLGIDPDAADPAVTRTTSLIP